MQKRVVNAIFIKDDPFKSGWPVADIEILQVCKNSRYGVWLCDPTTYVTHLISMYQELNTSEVSKQV